MRLPEQRLWDRFRRHSNAAGLLLNRVENCVGVGDPDVETIAVGGIVTKVELKAIEDPPKRASTALLGEKRGLSIEQRNFMLNWIGHGGRGFILIGVNFGIAARQYLVHGSYADTVNQWTLAQLRVRAAASDWIAINLILRGKL